MKKLVIASILAFLAAMGPAHAGIATFEDLTLATESYWNGADDGVNYYGLGTATWFTSGDNSFYNYQAINYDSWEGFAYSNTTDTVTPGMGNQYSAITGGGVNGSANYGVAFTMNMWSAQKAQTNNGAASGETSQIVDGFYITNTTYAVQSMLQGDAYAKVFGGEDGNDADWFKLTIHGLDSDYNQTGNSVDFYLADYRFENNSQDYIIDEWTWIDLSGLGAVSGLSFEMSSSDGGDGRSMNTPAYFAMDNFTTHPVPVPAAVWLLASGLLGLIGFQRKKPQS